MRCNKKLGSCGPLCFFFGTSRETGWVCFCFSLIFIGPALEMTGMHEILMMGFFRFLLGALKPVARNKWDQRVLPYFFWICLPHSKASLKCLKTRNDTGTLVFLYHLWPIYGLAISFETTWIIFLLLCLRDGKTCHVFPRLPLGLRTSSDRSQVWWRPSSEMSLRSLGVAWALRPDMAIWGRRSWIWWAINQC